MEDPSVLINQTISHYQILEKIGAGGMGIVYKAEDTTLKRQVALKFLPAELTRDEEAKGRFLHEARAAAALNHPNIVTVHEINEHKEQTFIVMEYMEGQTLKDLIAQRPLPVADAIAIAVQMARGLSVAHAKGIVHRDLKPANVFIGRDNAVKVLDFGIAKLASGQTRLTKTGTTLGTVAYMSPEQARGEEVDRRADIWSLGVILYEMLAGKPPFTGDYEQALVYAILNEEPKSLAKGLPELPSGLENIVLQALIKKPSGRYQSMEEFLDDLEAVGEGLKPLRARPARKRFLGIRKIYYLAAAALLAVLFAFNIGGLRRLIFEGAEASMIRSLAVLPLVNLSGDPDQEYIADGVHDALITNLAQLGGLQRVIGRNSVMRFKGATTPLRLIARELRVAALLTGAVLRSGNRVRVTAQLIDPTTEAQLWAHSYERDLRDVLVLQDEIVSAITQEIKLKLTPQDRVRLGSARPVNPEAYEAYLKGKFHLNKMTPEGYEKALSYLNQAIEKDPTNPLPYAQLALAYSVIGHERFPDAFAKAKEAARKAEELGAPSAEMYLAMGMTKLYSDWDYAGAEKDLRRAVELNPSLGEAHRDYSWYLFLAGRRDEALAEMKRAQDVEPLTPLFAADRAWQYWWMGQNDHAIEEARKSIDLDPNFAYALFALGSVYADKGMFAEAIAMHQKTGAADPGWRWGLPLIYVRAGKKEEARKTLDKFLAEKPPATGAWEGWFLAETYAALGDKDEAFRWLEAAYRERHSFMPWFDQNPAYAPLRSDPRFHDLMRRMNLPWTEKK